MSVMAPSRIVWSPSALARSGVTEEEMILKLSTTEAAPWTACEQAALELRNKPRPLKPEEEVERILYDYFGSLRP